MGLDRAARRNPLYNASTCFCIPESFGPLETPIALFVLAFQFSVFRIAEYEQSRESFTKLCFTAVQNRQEDNTCLSKRNGDIIYGYRKQQ